MMQDSASNEKVFAGRDMVALRWAAEWSQRDHCHHDGRARGDVKIV